MATFNVNSRVLDPNYRYKMPGLELKIEPIPKNRRRSQTTIINIERVAKALGVQGIPPEFILKWVSLELGAQMKVIKEVRKSRTVTFYNILAAIQINHIQPKLINFIENWILCRTCENPETDLWNLDKTRIVQMCYACGTKNEIVKTGKLATYISAKLGNEQPEPPKRYQEKIEETGDTEAQQQTIQIEGWTETDQIIRDDLLTIEEYLDMARENSKGARHLANSSGIMVQIPTSTRAHFFIDKLQMLNNTPQTIRLPEIHLMVELLQLQSKLVKPVLQRFLKLDSKNLDFKKLEISIKQNSRLLEAICSQDTAKSEWLILGFLQKVISRNKKKLLSYSANIVHLLYTEDIISEEVILKWADSKVSEFVKPEIDRQMKLKCQKIFDWLREDEDEEIDNESEVEQDLVIKKYVRQYYNYESEEDSNSESEIDIDKI